MRGLVSLLFTFTALSFFHKSSSYTAGYGLEVPFSSIWRAVLSYTAGRYLALGSWCDGCAVKAPVDKWGIFSAGYKGKALTKRTLRDRDGWQWHLCSVLKQPRNSFCI